MKVNPVARCTYWLLFLTVITFATMAVSKDETFEEGEQYTGLVVFCKAKVYADELAQLLVKSGREEADKLLTKRFQEELCNARPVKFKVIRVVSVFKDKETMYVIEVESGGTHFIVNSTPVTLKEYIRHRT